ncbi:Inorganic phosphate transporter PHO84 [Fusarium oxysporum f. sp. albedinis]|nr:Inorganic phosphate transporter PHO84 [Fusarium oxysporum f. sp. albedinis]
MHQTEQTFIGDAMFRLNVERVSSFDQWRCVEKELIYKVPSLGPHHSPLLRPSSSSHRNLVSLGDPL